MVFGFDAIVASLVLVLPGFIVVGIVIALTPSWDRFNPNPATYVLLSLAASVPLHLAFAWLSVRNWRDSVKPWFRAFDTFDPNNVTGLALAVTFLKPLFALLALSVLLGLLFSLVIRGASRMKNGKGNCAPSQKTVWRHIFEKREKAPNVIVVLDDRAYKGQARRVTTTESDPHIYLQDISVIPLNVTTSVPQWDAMQPLNLEGLLLKRDNIREMWFLKD